MLFVQPLIRLWSVIMSSNAKLNLLLPLLIACDASILPEKSLADNPEDLTDVQIQELINSSGMNQMEAEALEEEIYDLLDDCIEGDEDACDELSEIIEELEDDSEDDDSEDDDSEDDDSEDDDSEDDDSEDDSEDDSDSEDEDSEESSDDSEDDDSEDDSEDDDSEDDDSEDDDSEDDSDSEDEDSEESSDDSEDDDSEDDENTSASPELEF